MAAVAGKAKLATISRFIFPPASWRIPPVHADRMTAAELRAGGSRAGVFGRRMLGLFLILPVFAVHAPSLSGGDNLTLVGIALGAYGLSQAILQIPSALRW